MNGLVQIEGGEFQISDLPRQALARLIEQIQRSRSQQKILTRLPSCPPVLVDQSTQRGEQAGCAVDFVENCEFFEVISQIQLGVFKFSTVLFGRKVQIKEREAAGCGSLEGKRGLSGLPGPYNKAVAGE